MTITTENVVLNEKRNVRLTAMIQSVGNEFGKIDKRPAVLILPGGAYGMCSDREAEAVAYPYLQAGYQAFVLRYSVAEHKRWPNPLEDYEQTMTLIRSNCEQWHILTDKIAVIGFSAGGHLAACAATMSQNRPNAAILGYAAMDRNLVQAILPYDTVPEPSACVDAHTCPCFLFAARDDKIVPVINTVHFEQALIQNGIQFESHIYAYGGHGFSTCEKSIFADATCSRTHHWVKDSIAWLGDVFGDLTVNGMTEPRCAGRLNENWAPTLSAACSVTYLKQNKEAMGILKDVLIAIDETFSRGYGKPVKITDIFGDFQLAEMLTLVGQSRETIDSLDVALKQIPNK